MSAPGLMDRNGLLKGTDFLHLYTIGTLAREHRGDRLYDMRAQAMMAPELVPGAERIIYLPLYAPQVSLLFLPLAELPYGAALVAWLALTGMIYAGGCHAVWRRCRWLWSDGWTVVILAAGYPAFFHLIAWGQNSAIALLCFVATFLALDEKKPWLAGLALGLLVYKPSLLLGPVLVLLLAMDWRILAGAAMSAVGELSVGYLYYGVDVFRTYVQQTLHVGRLMPLLEPRPYQMHSLRAFWAMLVPSSTVSLTLYGISIVVVVIMTARIWRSGRPIELRYSALLFAAVLVSPHLTVYDLTVLAPSFLLLANWLVENWEDRKNWRLGTLLYFVFVLPLAGGLAAWTHVQLSVIAMAGVLGWLALRPRSGVDHRVAVTNLAAAQPS
jgi:hypothetical protein